jgi:hypothetical protein
MESETGAEPHSEGRLLREPSGQQPDQRPRPSTASPGFPFVRQAGWLSIMAGALFLIAQTVMWTFDQEGNLEAGWTLFGIASVRARVFPLPIAIAIIIGGIVGYKALLAPGGIPLGTALVLLGIWIVKTTARRTA